MMHRHFFLLVLLALLPSSLLLQGCATSGPEFKEVSPLPDGRALIYLYRESRMLGAAGSFTIFLNSNTLVELKNGAYIPVVVEPGPTVLSHRPAFSAINAIPWVAALTAISRSTVDWEKEGAVAIDAEPNKTYFVQWVIGGKMYLRSRQEAMPILASTKRLSPTE